uniref:Ig-like domain-containing protein n=1 Tax=Amphiprion percula TaxID=161767 RepID=A0A3P8RVU1_AMPPE
MRWILARCCGLALISLSVALQIRQKPRFYGVKTNRAVYIYCMASNQGQDSEVNWYRADEYDVPEAQRKQIKEEGRFQFEGKGMIKNAFLVITDLQNEDSGVYFCKMDDSWGPGTELRAVRPIQHAQALYRSQMKDSLMVLQGLMLAVCIAALLLRRRTLLEQKDSIYEEPETDHIYEGLAIETCGGGLYEELAVYSQADGAEAPWE